MALLCLLNITNLHAQSDVQLIRGRVIDSESRAPIIGANILLLDLPGSIGTSTDDEGLFRLEAVPYGRHNLLVSYISYTSKTLSNILVTSGKELVLEIELEESTIQLDEITISAATDFERNRSINPFSNVSSRTFSTEETSRYAASVFDPARMAQNFAGVSVASGSDDLFNEIVIRGNTPSGVLWRLEGIEIPNPNHFGDMGNSGGAISMLSSTTLSQSDFYTGAFPAEFGNATSGVFDLRLRKGNNEKREYSFMMGALGLEFGLEGPISQKNGSSYLVNYRYSTLAMIQAIGVNPTGEILPTYQDLSFNFNFPNKQFGTLSIFGLAGRNLAGNTPPLDSMDWEEPSDRDGFEEYGNMAVVGISHQKLLKNSAYLKTIISGSFEKFDGRDYEIDNSYNEIFKGGDVSQQQTLRVSSMFHNKLSNHNSIRIGAIASFKDFAFYLDDDDPENAANRIRLFDNESANSFLQAYGLWKYKKNDRLSFMAGAHFSYLSGNNKSSIEPRISMRWKLNVNSEISLATGLHSKMEHLAVYTFEGKFKDGFTVLRNNDLPLSKSYHTVLGYDLKLGQLSRMKIELYHQYLFDIPVEVSQSGTYSILNSFDIYDALDYENLVSSGKGRNIGIDLTLERALSKGYYMLMTGSFYDSKYKTQGDQWYNTRFNGRYQAHVLTGKEFKMRKNRTIGINAKFLISGGARYSEVDLENSRAVGYEVLFNDPPYNLQAGQYIRLDLGLKYQHSRKKSTHTIMFDIQNVTNRENPFIIEYDDDSGTLQQDDLLGMFPFVNYRIEF